MVPGGYQPAPLSRTHGHCWCDTCLEGSRCTFSENQQTVLAVVQQHLLPSEPGIPGAKGDTPRIGAANATFIFCLPGSTGACRTGWEKIISHQLDYRTRPCNLVKLMPRVLE